jgi:hypothetical protein
MVRVALVVVLVGVGAATAGCTARERHGAAGVTGVIYLTATRDGARVVYRVNPDGTGLQRLGDVRPDGIVNYGTPAFSLAPNGKAIAFDLNERLYFAGPDGSGIHPQAARFGSPSTWSPDGKSVAWSSQTGVEEIDVGSVDGKSVRAIPLGVDGEPAWSPKGDVIAVSQDAAAGAAGPPGIYTVHPDGTGRKPLATGGVFRNDVPIVLSWSPDASRLAVVTSFGSGELEHIYVVVAAGGMPRRLTSHTERNVSLAWSPDGSRIAFSSQRGKGPGEVYVIRSDGSDEHAVTRSTGGESSADPQWSPNGSWLVYVRGRFAFGDGSSGDDYLVRPDGAGRRPLLRPGDRVGEASAPVWADLTALPPTAPRSVRSVAATPLYTLRTAGVGEIAAGSATVAVEEAAPGMPPQFECGPIVLWTPRTGRTVRGGITCHPGNEWLDSLSLVASAPAWNFSAWDRYPVADCTLLWRPMIATPAGHVPYETLCTWPRSWLQLHHLVLIRRQWPTPAK